MKMIDPRAELQRFCDTLTATESARDRKFVFDALLGLLRGGDATLSRMAEALQEDRRPNSTAKRLSRRLSAETLDDEAVRAAYLTEVHNEIRRRRERPVTAIDFSDVQKCPSARALEGLCPAYDGSRREPGWGWPMLVSAQVFDALVQLPLAFDFFSTRADDYRSPSGVVRDHVARLQPYLPSDTVWVADRGFDGANFINAFRANGASFIVRLVLGGGKRDLTNEQGQRFPVRELVARTNYRSEVRVRGRRLGSANTKRFGVGWHQRLKMADPTSSVHRGVRRTRPELHSLVVAKRLGLKRSLTYAFLTDLVVTTPDAAGFVVRAFIKRWRIEDVLHITKQRFRLENIRTHRFRSTRRIGDLLLYATGFLALLAAKYPEASRELASTVWHVDDVPFNHLYRLRQSMTEALSAA